MKCEVLLVPLPTFQITDIFSGIIYEIFLASTYVCKRDIDLRCNVPSVLIFPCCFQAWFHDKSLIKNHTKKLCMFLDIAANPHCQSYII